MLQKEQVQGKVLDHLGIMASVIDGAGLVEMIDQRLVVSVEKGSKVSMGERVKAMILNGLGFVNERLYMFPKFMETKAIERLFGRPIEAKYFNDDALGRCLDEIKAHGATKLYSQLAFRIATRFKLWGRTSRFDTSTLSVHGDYEICESDESGKDINITYGYSKDHRFDLKQMTIALATSGESSFPVWMEAHDGNASDKVTLQESAQRMQKLRDELEDAPALIYVGDSAMYEACVKDGQNLTWLSRVPGSIKKAAAIMGMADSEVAWTKLDDCYKIKQFKGGHGGVEQRWVLVFSEAGYKLKARTLNRNIAKEKADTIKAIEVLSHKTFQCSEDAKNHFKASIQKRLKYHNAQCSTEATVKHVGKGRPKKGVAPEAITGYRISGTLSENVTKIEEHRVQSGRFILATNELDESKLSQADMLKEYKAQSKTEQGFRFIKNDNFHVSSVFLKKPGRIEALMMIMTLCLMVYALAELTLRKALAEANATIPNQVKKPTATPAMAYVCRLFRAVQVITIQFDKYTQTIITNLTDLAKRIVRYFGIGAERIYGLRES